MLAWCLLAGNCLTHLPKKVGLVAQRGWSKEWCMEWNKGWGKEWGAMRRKRLVLAGCLLAGDCLTHLPEKVGLVELWRCSREGAKRSRERLPRAAA